MRDFDGETSSEKQQRPAALEGGNDLMAAYLELALKIYLRIKNEGKNIHTCGFDDETDRVYDHPSGGSSTRGNPQN